MKKLILILIFTAVFLPSCKDVIGLEGNLGKQLVSKTPDAFDTLAQLKLNPVDLGFIKYGTAANFSVSIQNIGKNDTVTIYSVQSTNPTGLFVYSFPTGMPFTIVPGEDTQTSDKIHLKFLAQALNMGTYYDTLIINNQRSYFIPVRVSEKF